MVAVKRTSMTLDKTISSGRGKKLAARIKQGVAQERAWYRAQHKEAAEATKYQEFLLAIPRAAAPQALPAQAVLNLTPQGIAGILDAAQELREVAV